MYSQLPLRAAASGPGLREAALKPVRGREGEREGRLKFKGASSGFELAEDL